MTGVAVPPLMFGERFKVRSRSGSEYDCTFLHQGAGLIVRLADRRIARLDPQRVSWGTFTPLAGAGPALGAGDEVIAVTATETLRGTLTEAPSAGEVSVQSRRGEVRRLPLERMNELCLLFRARELRTGDRFLVRSRSGSAYQGRVLEGTADRARVRLDAGATVNLRLDRLDMGTLLVPVPVPIHEL